MASKQVFDLLYKIYISEPLHYSGIQLVSASFFIFYNFITCNFSERKKAADIDRIVNQRAHIADIM